MGKLITPEEFAKLRGISVTTVYTRMNIPQKDNDGNDIAPPPSCDINVELVGKFYMIDPAKNKHVKVRKWTNKKALLKNQS